MGTEETAYKVIRHEGAFEVRDYPALVAAEVTVSGERAEAASAGFRLLAAYIFGANTRKQSIAMTAPVVQAPAFGEEIAMTVPVTQTENSGDWIIRFVMPRGLSIDMLPKPNDTRVFLRVLPPSRVGVVRFSGLANEKDVQRKTAELSAFVADSHLRMIGPASLARYNPPWTPWFMRRNEVMFPLQPEPLAQPAGNAH